MDEERATLDALATVSNLQVASEKGTQIATSSDLEETIALTNALQQPSPNASMDLAQQTLIAVNSQTLLPVVSQGVIDDRSSYIMATQMDGVVGSNNQLTSALNNSSSTSASANNDNTTTIENTTEASGDMQVDSSSPLIIEFYEKFPVGKTFDSLEQLRKVALDYGKRYNVALTTSKSDKTKVYLICKHGGYYRKNVNKKKPAPKDKATPVKTRVRKSQKSGCSCLIYARCSKGAIWTIRKSIAEHNHPIAVDPRTYAMYRSLDSDQLAFVHKLLGENTSISGIVKILKEKGINNIVPKDIENIQQDLKRKLAALKKEMQQTTTTVAAAITTAEYLLPESSTNKMDSGAAAAVVSTLLASTAADIKALSSAIPTQEITLPPE